MQIRKTCLGCSCALIALAVLFKVTGICTYWYLEKTDTSHFEVLKVWDRLELGDTQAEVESTFLKVGAKDLELRKGRGYWTVRTPCNFSATNWNLWLTFEEERLVAMRVRMLDSERMVPRDAPGDKLVDDAPTDPLFGPKYIRERVRGDSPQEEE